MSQKAPLIKLLSGKSIPAVALGVYETPSGEAAKVVEYALSQGYRHIDSAAAYHNEQQVGQGILNFLEKTPNVKREDIFYTTKIKERDQGYENATRAIKHSLELVKGLEYIDLVLVHSPLSSREKRLGTWKALQEAVDAGLIKGSIGVSNFGIHHLKELLSWDGLKYKPSINQIELSPWLQRTELVQFCKDNGIAVEAYSPLTRGEKLDDPKLISLAKKYNKSPAQILIKWSLQKGFIPLPKSVHKDRIKSNIDVFDFELTPEEIDTLGDKNEYFWTEWDPTTAPL
ncbi:uncharacterized protein SAPINGB_P002857 [Magnusiomyces paraingens]|uniref:NADP-dependent oxidoreductase domain-containing protein n=1 Tax=Magnusiomyces paraingens TaxID=2606893 RepID=A0A5E8BM26_9ASCO|nr:uncharacterized protein SAPINGB_P002857 [Saprochaete ingens]VVT50718.1 unnamed protein product [Saprochaete ingens]